MPERFVIPEEHDGERVDKALAVLMPQVSRATVQRWIAQERVSINGERCRAKHTVRVSDVIDVEAGPHPPSRALPDPSVEVSVVHEDEDLIVVNKPAGLVVHPGRGHSMGTLVNGLLALPSFGVPPSDPLDREGPMRPGIVHRIDKDTSGLLVVAKTVMAREGLKQQLSEHSVERVYQALTLGVPAATTIKTLHGRHPRSRLKFTTRISRGREAITRVSVIEQLAEGRAALVECRLETGRTHQIRVHLAEISNHPILADALYGRPAPDAKVREIEMALGRQALHAGVLGFIHPRTGQRHSFAAALPTDMQTALARLRAG